MRPTGSKVNLTCRKWVNVTTVRDGNMTHRKWCPWDQPDVMSIWPTKCDNKVTYRMWRQCDLPKVTSIGPTERVTSMWPTGSDVNVPGGELPGRHPVLLSVEDVGAAAWAGAGGRRRRHRRTRGQRARGGDLLRARHSVHARQALHPLALNKNENRFKGVFLFRRVERQRQGKDNISVILMKREI